MSIQNNGKKKKSQDHGKIEQTTVLPFIDDIDDEEIEYDEKTLYKCIDCGYEENIPNWLIDEMCDASELLEDPENASDMTCPECNGTMKKKK